MSGYVYQTVRGITKRINWEKERIETFKKLRGSSDGTFWKDLVAVDAAIEEMKVNVMHWESWREVLMCREKTNKETNKKLFTP